jgi:hypothetical protein
MQIIDVQSRARQMIGDMEHHHLTDIGRGTTIFISIL